MINTSYLKTIIALIVLILSLIVAFCNLTQESKYLYYISGFLIASILIYGSLLFIEGIQLFFSNSEDKND